MDGWNTSYDRFLLGRLKPIYQVRTVSFKEYSWFHTLPKTNPANEKWAFPKGKQSPNHLYFRGHMLVLESVMV